MSVKLSQNTSSEDGMLKPNGVQPINCLPFANKYYLIIGKNDCKMVLNISYKFLFFKFVENWYKFEEYCV